MLARCMPSSRVCLFVCPSVTSRCIASKRLNDLLVSYKTNCTPRDPTGPSETVFCERAHVLFCDSMLNFLGPKSFMDLLHICTSTPSSATVYSPHTRLKTLYAKEHLVNLKNHRKSLIRSRTDYFVIYHLSSLQL